MRPQVLNIQAAGQGADRSPAGEGSSPAEGEDSPRNRPAGEGSRRSYIRITSQNELHGKSRYTFDQSQETSIFSTSSKICDR